MTDDELRVVRADLALPEHAEAVVALLDAYARDPWGDGKPLADDVRERLVPGLRAHPTALVLLAMRGEEEARAAVGVAVAFVGFSTFAARPLINLHDLAVLPEARGVGVGRRLLAALEAEARERGCCKITLEVVEQNDRARGLYERVGFAPAVYRADAGRTLFYWKPLGDPA